MEHEVIRLAETVISREPARRPEAKWIQQKVDRFADAEGTKSRAETDQLIFGKMYAKAPKKTDITKIRYWRTGYHLPAGREEAMVFARALRLNERETIYFLQACMEKSDLVFEHVPEAECSFYSVYKERTALMEAMVFQYIESVPPARMFQMDLPYEKLERYVRHLYCIDALNGTVFAQSSEKKEIMQNHLSSSNYESEFLRTRRLLGEIPRKSMLRQIFLLGLPYLNRRLIDERLLRLGYLPLTEGHTSQKGALVDDLIIGLLRLYEASCTGKDPLTCRHWMFEQLSMLDRYFLDCKKEEYRFLYFRMLSTMDGYAL